MIGAGHGIFSKSAVRCACATVDPPVRSRSSSPEVPMLAILCALTAPIRWVAVAHRAIEDRAMSAAMREAAWANAIQAGRTL